MLFSMWFFGGFVANIAPTWPQLGAQNESKIDQKSIKKCIIILMSILIDFLLILDRSWIDFGAILASKLAGRVAQNHAKTNCFFYIFGFLAILPTRGHMINFLANLALNMRLKTLQNSTQDASKIDQKSIPTSIKIFIKILIDFWSNLGPT